MQLHLLFQEQHKGNEKCIFLSKTSDRFQQIFVPKKVGGYPDYMMTLWDWKTASVILRCKAFSQEVYNVRFSPYHHGHLITSGTGHIRFWKMASTFTGLKLQGELGKFGKVELSDICAFTELGDGKLLSGNEFGQLLLWDGELIKVGMVLSLQWRLIYQF